MASVSDWKVSPSVQPKAENYRYDLERALASVVGLHTIIPADAFTAETLGTERAGNGVLIRDGLVLALHKATGDKTLLHALSLGASDDPAFRKAAAAEVRELRRRAEVECVPAVCACRSGHVLLPRQVSSSASHRKAGRPGAKQYSPPLVVTNGMSPCKRRRIGRCGIVKDCEDYFFRCSSRKGFTFSHASAAALGSYALSEDGFAKAWSAS